MTYSSERGQCQQIFIYLFRESAMQASSSHPFVGLCRVLTSALIKPFCPIRREVWKFHRLGPAQNAPSLLVYAFQSKRKAFRRASELPASALQDDINFHILCVEKRHRAQPTLIPVTTMSGGWQTYESAAKDRRRVMDVFFPPFTLLYAPWRFKSIVGKHKGGKT